MQKSADGEPMMLNPEFFHILKRRIFHRINIRAPKLRSKLRQDEHRGQHILF